MSYCWIVVNGKILKIYCVKHTVPSVTGKISDNNLNSVVHEIVFILTHGK